MHDRKVPSMPQILRVLAITLVQPPYRRFAPIGDTPLYKKQLGVFLQIFSIVRKKGENNFERGGIG
jgi:hypothetical protein